MPRLFTGLEIPEPLGRDLALLRGGLFGARWIDEEDYHLTLRFIGDIDDALAEEVWQVLGQIRRRSFTVTLDGLDVFGGDKPRMLIARAKADPALVELQAEQERLLRRIGLAPEPRKFRPHVTLARLKSVSETAAADYLASRGYFPSRAFEASRFVLYSARESVGGGPYVVEEAYPLR